LKKSFIALAAAMACGIVAAQGFTAEGTVALEYQNAKRGDVAGTTSSGFGAAQSELRLAFQQKFGTTGTFDAKAVLGVADPAADWTVPTGDRTAGKAYGKELSFSYTNTSFGRIKVYSIESQDYFTDVAGLGLSGSGQPLIEMDGKLHEIKGSNDGISYTFAIGPVYLQVSHAEPKSSIGIGPVDQGSGGNSQTKRTYSAYYASGPLTLLAGVRSYTNQREGACTLTDCPAIYVTKDSLYNLQGAYDFGAVKVGLGYQNAKATSGATQTDTLVSAAVPWGPWTLAAAYATSKTSNTPDVSAFGNLVLAPGLSTGGVWPALPYEGTQNGTSLGARYAFNKNLSVMLRYASWQHSGYSRLEADATVKPAAIAGYFGALPGLIGTGNVPGIFAAAGAAQAATAGLTPDNTATETSFVLAYSF